MKKFVGLDLLRFGLAVYLMIFHTVREYPQNATIPLIELTNLGGFATSTFFILSGFILSHVYFGRTTELRGGTKEFFVKRLSNLYPVHLISLFLLLVVSATGTQTLNSFSLMSLNDGDAQVVLGGADTAINFVLNILLLQVWNPLYASINAPSWSLSTLLCFYLAFPFLAPRLLGADRKVRLLVVLWVLYLIPPAVATLMHWYGPAAVGLITRNPLLRLPEFLAGILLYGLYREGRLAGAFNDWGKLAASLSFVAASFVYCAWLESHGPIYSRYVIHNGALLPAELLLVAVFAFVSIRQRHESLCVRLGNAALSIFAIHVPLFFIMMKVLKLLQMGESPIWCASHFSACVSASKHVVPSMATYPLYLLVTVIVAVYFQERLLVPVRALLRARFLGKPAQQSTSVTQRRGTQSN
ncbi:acyltransferase [Caballeronia sp. LZ062]|uniref:acyltransferase family protein n=1 Tax=unclassified Caballeronia TaxID=2646786 RepID=UPI002857B4CA|nr:MULTISPECIES: acyltransferase [unclassified Caballeronia]MDR5855745.1 acyltransferase [Caballeronia sp. LZ050]MDR5872468.1 acyltransferase [Caballeronia sp. LZ062]